MVVAERIKTFTKTAECFRITAALARDAFASTGCRPDFDDFRSADPRRPGGLLSASPVFAMAAAAGLGVEALLHLPEPVLRPRIAARLGVTSKYLHGFHSGWYAIGEAFLPDHEQERLGFRDGAACLLELTMPGSSSRPRCF